MKSGIWDTKLFPITKKDKEIEGINTDRLRFNDAVKNYNDYVIHLSKKYQSSCIWEGQVLVLLFHFTLLKTMPITKQI